MSVPRLDLGLIAEGVVELDPMSGNLVIRTEDEHGKMNILDVQAQLEKYKGRDVRFVISPMDTVNQLAKMVEEGDLALDQVPNLKLS